MTCARERSVPIPECDGRLRQTLTTLAVAAGLAGSLVGLVQGEEQHQEVMDSAFWKSELWNDGGAEIAFYELSNPQTPEPVLAGTILVKHRLDRRGLFKVDGKKPGAEEAWQWIFLYRFEATAAGPTRHFFQLDARRRDLQPWRFRAVESSWDGHCSYSVELDQNEAALQERGRSCKTLLPLSELEQSHPYEEPTYLRAQVPLLVRGVDFRNRARHGLTLLAAGRRVQASLERLGVETVRVPNGAEEAEKIVVEYSQAPRFRVPTAPPTPFGAGGRREIYWRRTGGNRQILRMEGRGYGMTLIEELRAKHWEEDFSPRLERVRRYP